jgi:hypothetical protein
VREVDGLDLIARIIQMATLFQLMLGEMGRDISPKSSDGRAASRRFFKGAAVPSSESITGMR